MGKGWRGEAAEELRGESVDGDGVAAAVEG